VLSVQLRSGTKSSQSPDIPSGCRLVDGHADYHNGKRTTALGRMKTSPPRCLGQQREPLLQRPQALAVLVGQGPTAGGDLEESLVVPGES
jgi:hypothetical protein